MAHTYTYYNLRINSDIPLIMHKREDRSAAPDLVIEKANIPSFSRDHGIIYEYSGSEFTIKSPEFVAILREPGSRVRLDLISGYTENSLTQFLIRNVLPISMFFKEMLQLHASVVSKNGRGICIFGESGAGKSTLSANFVNKGYSLLDDNRTVLREEDNVLIAQGHYPRTCLDMSTASNIDLSSWHKIAEREDGKTAWAPPNAVWHASAPLSHLIYIYVGATFDIRVEEPSRYIRSILEHIVLAPILVQYFPDRFFGLIEVFFSETPFVIYSRAGDKRELEIVELLEGVMQSNFHRAITSSANA